MWELHRHWLRDILVAVHQTVIVACHGLGRMAESIWNDVDEVLDLVAVAAGTSGCVGGAGEQRRGYEGGGADVHFGEGSEVWGGGVRRRFPYRRIMVGRSSFYESNH